MWKSLADRGADEQEWAVLGDREGVFEGEGLGGNREVVGDEKDWLLSMEDGRAA